MPKVEVRKRLLVLEEIFHEGGPPRSDPHRRGAVLRTGCGVRRPACYRCQGGSGRAPESTNSDGVFLVGSTPGGTQGTIGAALQRAGGHRPRRCKA